MLRVLQFTDTHLYVDKGKTLYGANPDQNLQRVIEHSMQHAFPADLALLTGDIVHDSPAAAYQRIKQHFEALKIPVYCLAGNHDDSEIMKQVLVGDLVQMARSLIRDNWQIIFLDSTVPGLDSGRLSVDELACLEKCLAEYPDLHTLVCLHHPPFTTGSQWLDNSVLLENPQDLFAVVDNSPQVRGVLWGHIHQEYYTKRNDVHYFATPSTVVQFKKNSVEFAVDSTPPAYRWLNLHADGKIETEVQYI